MTIQALFVGFALFCGAAQAQSVRLSEDSAAAETEYRDAEDAWLKNDVTLEKDLFKAKPDEMRTRIRRAAELRDQVMLKKASYLDFVLKRMDMISARLDSAKEAEMPIDDLKKSLEEEQTRILGEQDRLEDRIHGMPEGDEYLLVRREMDEERTALVSLQNNVARRIYSLGKMGADLKPGQESDTSAGFKEIRQLLEGEKNRAVRGRPKWARYYSALEQSLAPEPEHKKGKKKAS